MLEACADRERPSTRERLIDGAVERRMPSSIIASQATIGLASVEIELIIRLANIETVKTENPPSVAR